MNAVAYIRLSGQDQSNYSIDAQQRAITDYCNRNNLTLLSTFTDNGESSYTFDRPDFVALETFIKKNRNVNYLIIFHYDRFSRNLAEALLKIKALELKFRIQIRSINDPLDIDYSDPANFMKRAFEFMMAENELHRIRARTKAGIRQAALNGRHTSTAPWGYMNARDADNKPVLVIDEEKASQVRMIFREFLNGMSLYELHRMIQRYGFKRSGNSAIKRILQNPIYAGLIRAPASRTEPSKLVKGLHAPLISEQDYWIAQDLLKGKGNTTQNREEVPLRGVLRTPTGRYYTAMNARSKTKRYYWYYQDQDSKKLYSANRLHNQFYSILDHLSFDAKTLEWFRSELSHKIDEQLKTRGQKIKDVREQIKLVEKRIETVEEKYLTKPDISEATYNRVIGELRADLARLQNQLATLNSNQQIYWNRLNEILLKMSDLRDAFVKMELHKKHQFVNLVFCNDLSYDGVTYKTPRLHPLFTHNTLTLKQKGLLVIAAPVINLGGSPIGTGDGSPTKPAYDDNDLISNFVSFSDLLKVG